jgi:glycosyltransferase involved in cell wall biosynthesis
MSGGETLSSQGTRVAHLVHGLMMGGLEQMVVRLCVASRAHGIEPVVVAFGADGAVRAQLERERIPLVYLGKVKGLSPQALHGIARAFRAHRVDIAHAHDFGPWLNAVAARSLVPQVRVMATFHQMAVPSGVDRGAAVAGTFLSDALVACGGEVRACIARWAPPVTRVELIGNGIPLVPPFLPEDRVRARQRLGVPLDAKVIGYLGRLHHEKGPDLLLEAFLERFAHIPDVHLVVIGRGPTGFAADLEPSLRRRAAESRCARIHLVGEVVDASALLAAFDVYAQPSRREGRSLAMLEAMAAGIPAVISDLPAIREVHADRETALLVDASDSRVLGRAIERLLDDAALREHLATRSREHARRFSVEVMASEYASLYRDLRDGRENWFRLRRARGAA